MGSNERLEGWLKADKECPPLLYRRNSVDNYRR